MYVKRIRTYLYLHCAFYVYWTGKNSKDKSVQPFNSASAYTRTLIPYMIFPLLYYLHFYSRFKNIVI